MKSSRTLYFPAALRDIVTRYAVGSQVDFAEMCGLTAATISRLCSGKRPATKSCLVKLAAAVDVTDRKGLYLAAVRDFLPQEGKDLVFPARRNPGSVGLLEEAPVHGKLQAETQRFLAWLASDAAVNKDTERWLLTLAAWMQG
jgi:transcriptional regulator with XRE-family HTH domain